MTPNISGQIIPHTMEAIAMPETFFSWIFGATALPIGTPVATWCTTSSWLVVAWAWGGFPTGMFEKCRFSNFVRLCCLLSLDEVYP